MTREAGFTYGFFPGSHSGLKSEFANQRMGSSIDRMAFVMCAKLIWRISSEGW